jgi:hypothetical protein
MDYLRKHAGWIRAHKKFLKQHPVNTHGFRAPKLSPDEVEQIQQNLLRSAAKKTRHRRTDNLVGCEYDLLLVWQLHAALAQSPWWWCLCACGGFEKFKAIDLVAGRVTDCGCRESERVRIAKLRKLKKAA